MAKMIAARLHKYGGPLHLDEVERPEPRPGEVRIRVAACNIVPNLKNVLSDYWQDLFPHLLRPKLPAIFGLDVAGTVDTVGEGVFAFRPGMRVYVNPARGCGDCRHCRNGEYLYCPRGIFQGYFSRTPEGVTLFDFYPTGGLGEYLIAPADALVSLPDNVSFEAGARFGYIGTGYGALVKARMRPGETVVVNGIGGTLGLGTAISALAMGATKVFGTGRNQSLLDRVKAVDPDRIEVLAVGDDTRIGDWVRGLTAGYGADLVVDALPPGAPASAWMEAADAVRVGGTHVDIGAVNEPLTFPGYWIKARNATIIGSRWFTAAEGQEIAEMAGAGTLDLSIFDHHRFALADVNNALAALHGEVRGFDNFVVMP